MAVEDLAIEAELIVFSDQFVRNYSLERSTPDAYSSWDDTSGKVTTDATAVL
jgi:hypothetical protein